tara:strand:- start:78 stop:398 length:321 start_codon:yes stop_codon:yes gene_type:complete
MKFRILIILLSGMFIILNSCGTFKEAGSVLRNEKSRKADEFLIEKKGPLTQPPDFKSIPEPGSKENKAAFNKNSVEKMLKKNQSEPSNNQTKSSSTEEFILNQIKK